MKMLRLLVGVVLLLPSSLPLARAQALTSKSPPLTLKGVKTAAVVDLSRAPLGALFDVKARQRPELTWVERTQVEKVVSELQLQMLFGAVGGGQRVQLGQLLKADVLVLLRSAAHPQEKGQQVLEMVVCESQRGLRLANHALPLAEKSDTALPQLEAVLVGGLAKLTHPITEVCAVPPFLSQDLGYEHDHLKGAFARIVEQHLLRRPGVLLVELAEAEALAKEGVLSGTDSKVERKLPLYFLGEYRNEGQGDARRLTLNLKLQRGSTQLGLRQRKDIAPREAAQTLAKLADELAAKLLATPEAGVVDTRAEIAQLVERSKAFQRLGNLDEALALVEAALLLDFNQPEMHMLAADYGATCAKRHYGNVRFKDPQGVVIATTVLQHYQRMLEHLEISVRIGTRKRLLPPRDAARDLQIRKMEEATGKKYPRDPQPWPRAAPSFPACSPAVASLLGYWIVIGSELKQLPKVAQHLEELERERRETLLRLCRFRAAAGGGDEHAYLGWAVVALPPAEQQAARLKMSRELKHLPYATERTVAFAGVGHGLLHATEKDFATFVDELARDEDPAVRAAAPALRLARTDLHSRFARPQPTPVVRTAGVTTQEIRFLPTTKALSGCIRLEGNGDIFICSDKIYLMKEKGKARLLWDSRELNTYINHFSFDGRYLWFSADRPANTSRLFILEPLSGALREITAADGLPTAEQANLPAKSVRQTIALTTLGPGKACLAGYFGRTWVGMAEFHPGDGIKIKVFHEAREAFALNDPTRMEGLALAFVPGRMYLLDGGTQGRRILLSRSWPNVVMGTQPLLIDLDRQTVEIRKQIDLLDNFGSGCLHEGAIWYIRHGPLGAFQSLARLTFPGDKHMVQIERVPGGRVLIEGNEVHLLTGTEWWRGTLEGKQLRLVGTMPDNLVVHYVGWSNHYGLLLGGRRVGGGRQVVFSTFQVTLAPNTP